MTRGLARDAPGPVRCEWCSGRRSRRSRSSCSPPPWARVRTPSGPAAGNGIGCVIAMCPTDVLAARGLDGVPGRTPFGGVGDRGRPGRQRRLRDQRLPRQAASAPTASCEFVAGNGTQCGDAPDLCGDGGPATRAGSRTRSASPSGRPATCSSSTTSAAQGPQGPQVGRRDPDDRRQRATTPCDHCTPWPACSDVDDASDDHRLNQPEDVAAATNGDVYFSDPEVNVIRRLISLGSDLPHAPRRPDASSSPDPVAVALDPTRDGSST